MFEDKLKENKGEYLLKKFTDGKFSDLIEEIDKLMEEYGESSFGYSLLGNCFFNIKDYEESIKAFEKEIKISKEEHFLPYYNLGRNFGALENSNLEISNYLKSYTINPNRFETNYELGMAYIKIEDYINSEKYLINAHNLKKDDPLAVINLLSLLHKMGKYSSGVEIGRKASKEFEKFFQFCYNYALMLYEEKELEESNNMNNKVLNQIANENNPIFLDALGLKANILNAQMEIKEAINTGFKILKEDQNHYVALKSLTTSFSRSGNHRASIFFDRLADGNIRFEINNEGSIDLFMHQNEKAPINV